MPAAGRWLGKGHMSKKQDFLRNEQSRDQHPESNMVGSAASVEEEQRRKSVQNVSPQDRQEAHTGKYGNDHNKMGEQHATQTNQGRRTPESRHDKEMHVGGDNRIQSRQANPQAGESHGPSGG